MGFKKGDTFYRGENVECFSAKSGFVNALIKRGFEISFPFAMSQSIHRDFKLFSYKIREEVVYGDEYWRDHV